MLEELKSQVEIGKLTKDLCTHLGAKDVGVLRTCDKATKASRGFLLDGGSFQDSYYQKGKQEIALSFTEHILLKIKLSEPKYQTISKRDIQKVWGDPDEIYPEKPDQLSKQQQLVYFVEDYKMEFSIDFSDKKLEHFSMEYKYDKKPKVKNKSIDPNRKEVHKGDQNYRITKIGKKAVGEVKKFVTLGHLPYYDCQLLGSQYDPNKLCRPTTSHETVDIGKKTRILTYNFRNRSIFLGYYQNSLSEIRIEQEKPFPFTREDVKQIFGKPKKDKKDISTFLTTNYVVYEVENKEVQFGFDQQDQCFWINTAILVKDVKKK